MSLLAMLGWLAFGGSFLVASHFPPWTAFQQELLAAIGVALIGVAALVRNGRWPWPPIALVTSALVAVPLAQAAAGQLIFAADGILCALYVLALALAIALGATLFDSDRERFLDALTAALTVAALLSVPIAAAQLFRVPLPPLDIAPLALGGRPYANLSQPNHLATLLLLGLIGVGWHFERRRIGAATATLLAAVLVVGLVATQSRGALVGLVSLVAWACWAARRRLTAVTPVSALSCLASVAALTVAWPSLLRPLDLSAGRGIEQMASGGLRPAHWASFAQAIADTPWLGYGWNQVIVAQGAVAASRPPVGEMLDFSHNVLLDLFLWNGIPIGLAIIAGFSWWFWRQMRSTREPAGAVLLGGLIVLLTHAMLEYPLSYSYFLLPFGLMIGALESLNALVRRRTAPALLNAGLVALSIGTTAVVALDYLGIEEDYRTLRMEGLGLATPESAADVPPATIAKHWREFLVFARTPARPGMSDSEIDRMRRVYLRFPQPPVLLRYAVASGLNGRPDEAREAITRLCRIHPQPRCDEGREAWRLMSSQAFPQLQRIAFPEP